MLIYSKKLVEKTVERVLKDANIMETFYFGPKTIYGLKENIIIKVYIDCNFVSDYNKDISIPVYNAKDYTEVSDVICQIINSYDC